MATETIALIVEAQKKGEETFRETNRFLDGLGSKAKAAGKLMAGGLAIGGVALAGVGVAAFDMASDIDQATRDVAAKLGMTEGEAKGFEGVMKGVFANNFGEDFEDIAGAVVALQQNLKDLAPASDSAQQALLEGGFALRDAYGVELEETFNAVNTLMEDFSLDSQEAMNLVTAGFQQGLNSSDDFLDTIGEYSTQFSNAGADAGQFFSLLESGMQGGMLGTDRAADAFKEFRVRIQDGSKATSEALGLLGIDSQELAAQMADGTVTAADAFQLVIDKLNETDDANVLMQAGVGLLGTQFEDLGTEAALALDLTGTKIGDLAGATDSLNVQYDSLGAVFEGAWRGFLVAIEPAGAGLLDMANQAMPAVSSFLTNTLTPAMSTAADWLAAQLPAAIQTASDFWTGTLQPALELVWAFIQDPVFPTLGDLKKWLDERIPQAIDFLKETWETVLRPALQALRDFIEDPVIPMLGQFKQWLDENVPAAIAFLKETWETVLRPALQALRDFIEDPVIPIISLLADWLQDHIPTAVDAVKTVWETVLRPALQSLKDFIEDPVIPIISTLVDWFAETLPEAWRGLQTVWNEVLKPMLDAVKGGLDAVGGAIDSVIGFFDRLKDAINNLPGLPGLPDWMPGASPPKMAQWLMDIGHAAIMAEMAMGEFGTSVGRLPALATVPISSAGGEALRSPSNEMTLNLNVRGDTPIARDNARLVADELNRMWGNQMRVRTRVGIRG